MFFWSNWDACTPKTQLGMTYYAPRPNKKLGRLEECVISLAGSVADQMWHTRRVNEWDRPDLMRARKLLRNHEVDVRLAMELTGRIVREPSMRRRIDRVARELVKEDLFGSRLVEVLRRK